MTPETYYVKALDVSSTFTENPSAFTDKRGDFSVEKYITKGLNKNKGNISLVTQQKTALLTTRRKQSRLYHKKQNVLTTAWTFN